MRSPILNAPTIPNDERIIGLLHRLLTDRGMDDCGGVTAATERAILQCHKNADVPLRSLASEAEHHGVAPLIAPLIAALSRKLPEAIPDDIRRVFGAITSRHRRATALRERCVDELLIAFAATGIPVVLLKGAALAHRIYPQPELRPMVDIDMLIDRADAERASAVIRQLGYISPYRHTSRFAGRMHHLPPATMERSGFRITIELHHDTMSPNVADSLTFATLTAQPLPFRRGRGPEGLALGHTDMLRHLARHAFEPARRIRLIHLYDLWRYEAIFHDAIEWRELALRFPNVMVVLRLVSCVFASPRSTSLPGQAACDRLAAGVGLGMMPLSEIAGSDMAISGKLAALFNPPAWWLHGFYGIAPEKSLLMCRAVRHPATLARWLSKRVLAGVDPSAPAA